MERDKEYHDPDYPEVSATVKKECSNVLDEEKVEKIKDIVRREFTNELQSREEDIMLADQRSLMARRLLQRLRYVLVHNYYTDERLKITAGQIQDEVAAQSEPRSRSEVGCQLRDGQRRLHPSVRKLLGRQSSAVELHEILHPRGPRNKSRRDYSAMIQSRNYTIPADMTKSLRPSPEPEQPEPQASTSRPKKIPRRTTPMITNVVTLDEATRNQTKHRYRIIIGNTSKFVPPSSSADRSTHKWLLYVRGPPEHPDLGPIVTAVTVKLHHSYAPHHTVHIDKPPFVVSRRGWGEFPARVELSFAEPQRNRPAALTHTLKLDRNYTGLQTLGAETLVDVWLYSTEEMLKYEYKKEDKEIKTEPMDITDTPQDNPQVNEPTDEQSTLFETTSLDNNDSWLDFFSNTTELDVDEMIIKPQKKIEDKEIEKEVTEEEIENFNNENHFSNNHEENEVNDETFGDENKKDHGINNLLIKQESLEDFPNELLTPSPKKRIMKYLDPTTGKIYYLEMDRKLDLTKVQEIVINSKGNVKTAKISPIKPNGLKKVRKTKKGGVSLLKPEVKSLLKNENKTVKSNYDNYSHIENDHCYISSVPKDYDATQNKILEEIRNFEDNSHVKDDKCMFKCICAAVQRLNSVKLAVGYCLKYMPIVTSVSDPDYQKMFPYVVDNEERYWKLDFAKRRNIEWTRAKLINKLLTEHLTTSDTIWRTKQILIYARLHGFYPIRTKSLPRPSVNDEWSSWTDFERVDSDSETNHKPSETSTLTKFNPNDYSQNLSDTIEVSDSEDEIEIVSWDEPVKVKKELVADSNDLPVLPVMDNQERLRYLYVERKCADIGIELRNEDIGNGYSYSAVHAVLLSAMKSFAEDMIRSSLACRLMDERDSQPMAPTWVGSSSRTSISLSHTSRAATGRLALVSKRSLATDTHTIQHL